MGKTCGNCGCGMATCACKLLAAGGVVGAGLAFLYAGNAGESGLKSGSLWGAAVAYGIGIAYIVLSIVECILQGRAVKADSLGGGVEWSDREVAAEQGGALKGKSMVARDARALLGAWGAGASGGITHEKSTPLGDPNAQSEYTTTMTFSLSHSRVLSRRLSRTLSYTYTWENSNFHTEGANEKHLVMYVLNYLL